MRQILRFLVGLTVMAFIAVGLAYGPAWYRTTQRTQTLRQWLTDPSAHPELALAAGNRCPGAPFVLPTDGFLGYGWGDIMAFGHLHQGIDVFGPGGLDETPVVAADDGYLTREDYWKSAVIIRHPNDPLHPGQQIWTYYAHMASPSGLTSYILPEFAPGTYELFITAGTLLGYLGDYSGDPDNPVGIHLHFSVDQSNADGSYKNELDINNTYNPAQYLGLVDQNGVWQCG